METTPSQPVPVKSEFKRDGFDFKLIKRTNRTAMLQKSKPHYTVEYFEVVILQVNKARTFPNGTHYPESEGMPSSETWGTYGWSYSNRQAAEKAYLSRCVD